jgi:hypothetical protein
VCGLLAPSTEVVPGLGPRNLGVGSRRIHFGGPEGRRNVPPKTDSETRRATRTSSGAGDGIRTHDVQLGRLTLYQLSYSRSEPAPAGNRPEAISGGCWIRTNVGNAGRFTACSLWPLGQPSKERGYFSIGADEGTRTPNHLFTKQVLYRLSYASRADLRRAQTGAGEGRHSVKTSMGHRGEQTIR